MSSEDKLLRHNWAVLPRIIECSNYGSSFKSIYRGSRFRKPNNVSPEEWHAVAGPDMRTDEHAQVTARLTRFARNKNMFPPPDWPGQIDPALQDEQLYDMLELMAYVHDWPEAVMHAGQGNDRALPDKDAAYLIDEQQILREMTEVLFPGEDNVEMRQRMEAAAFYLNNESTFEGQQFGILEQMGYLTVPAMAWRRLLNHGHIDRPELRNGRHPNQGAWVDQPGMQNALRLYAGEIPRHVNFLLPHAQVNPAVWSFLDLHAPTIDDFYDNFDPQTYRQHPPQHQGILQMYQAGVELWDVNRSMFRSSQGQTPLREVSLGSL